MTRALSAGALLLLWLVQGCAAGVSQPSRQAPSSPAAGRAELQELEQQIATGRAALGLPVRRVEPTKEAAGQDAAAAPPAPSVAPAEEAEVRSSEPLEARAGKERKDKDACSVDPCRYTRAICEAANRVCDIARYLGDDEARGRCDRAVQDCADARRVTRDSCPGC